MHGILEQNRIAKETINRTIGAFGERIGLMGKIFGCWHQQLSRPFTVGKQSYRSCLHCGARKNFNTETLKTSGPFYYPPALSFANLPKNKDR